MLNLDTVVFHITQLILLILLPFQSKLLFNIYTTDILNSIKGCKVQAYSDNRQLYFDIDVNSFISAESKINNEFKNKCNVILFGNKNQMTILKERLSVKLDNTMFTVSV